MKKIAHREQSQDLGNVTMMPIHVAKELRADNDAMQIERDAALASLGRIMHIAAIDSGGRITLSELLKIHAEPGETLAIKALQFYGDKLGDLEAVRIVERERDALRAVLGELVALGDDDECWESYDGVRFLIDCELPRLDRIIAEARKLLGGGE